MVDYDFVAKDYAYGFEIETSVDCTAKKFDVKITHPDFNGGKQFVVYSGNFFPGARYFGTKHPITMHNHYIGYCEANPHQFCNVCTNTVYRREKI